MAPYYIMMRLPGETETEFFLMLPMAPSQRENMIAWLAARCDPPSTANSSSTSSPRKSWSTGLFRSRRSSIRTPRYRNRSRCGTRWARGSFAGICWSCRSRTRSCTCRRSICARRSGQLPELKRVIAAYGERVVMEETLPAALAALFKESAPSPPCRSACGPRPSGPADARAREALADYERAIERLKAGDWAGFGAELDALRPLLEELSGAPAAH